MRPPRPSSGGPDVSGERSVGGVTPGRDKSTGRRLLDGLGQIPDEHVRGALGGDCCAEHRPIALSAVGARIEWDAILLLDGRVEFRLHGVYRMWDDARLDQLVCIEVVGKQE